MHRADAEQPAGEDDYADCKRDPGEGAAESGRASLEVGRNAPFRFGEEPHGDVGQLEFLRGQDRGPLVDERAQERVTALATGSWGFSLENTRGVRRR